LLSLADRQRAFGHAILADAGRVPDGLVVPTGAPAGERFDVYRNNVAAALIESLRSTFPVVEQLVGVDFFRAMARTYTRDTPPSSPVLLAYGGGFSDFIKGFPPASELPYLADVAQLEWQWVRAYHAADAEPVSLDVLQQLPAEKLPGARLSVHPSVAVLSFEHPALSIWRRHGDGDVGSMDDLVYGPESALVWREGVDVRATELGPGAAGFVACLQQGQTLGEAAAMALDAESGLDLAALIQGMFQLSIFVDVVGETWE
jgi:hypothetical protein